MDIESIETGEESGGNDGNARPRGNVCRSARESTLKTEEEHDGTDADDQRWRVGLRQR